MSIVSETQPPEVRAPEGARVLIVDDSATVRLKLSKAIQMLGHETTAVASGKLALEQVAQNTFDLVLLDIVMPEMDGFEVLKTLKSSRATRDLPVIVISALDEEMSSVVNAIELGAEDFLPKDFEPALLEARVSTCIEKKRLRDIEKEYLRQVAKLTRAASALEAGKFNPSKLGLQDVTGRRDGLGKLATVFSTMAQKVYERERQLRQNIRTFRGGLLLIACGALWGLIVPLSKMAANIAAHPIGLALLVDAIGAALCIGICASRKTLPPLNTLTKTEWTYIAGLAFLSSVINQLLVYWLVGKLPAFVVAIVIVLEGFAVFLFAAVMRVESPRLKRFLGLAIGLIGVGAIMVNAETGGEEGQWLWMALALLIPATYAAEDLYISQKQPANIDSVAIYGLALTASCFMLIPLAVGFSDFIPVQFLAGKLGVIVILIALASALAMILFIYLIRTTGAVFASQSAYATTVAGIGWSIVLLGEYIPLWTWAALGLIIVGLIMVEPKQEAEEEPPLLDGAIEDLPI
ncbi:response regulator [Mesorhizobium waimense]|uniref:Response regulator n=1 Tax=Mesorhizobium waimense TaxID=1300307 RepID=A0A3A5JRV5_9HYPH|nr:response regulator [Mesorhizobium waimense]RJT22985.1 response regulator [Mesorhizobium waimense]